MAGTLIGGGKFCQARLDRPATPDHVEHRGRVGVGQGCAEQRPHPKRTEIEIGRGIQDAKQVCALPPGERGGELGSLG
jgi:hypothetical protein